MAGGGPTVTLTFAGDADKLNKAFDSVGSSASGMASKIDSSSGSIDRTGGALSSFGDSADGAEGKAQGFTDVIAGSVGIMQGFTDESLSMTDRLQMIGSGVADMAGGIASFLVPALTAGVSGIKAMSLALLTSPITWIVLGIALIVGAFILLWQNVEGFRNFWKGAWDLIKSVAGGVINNIIGIVKGFGQMIKGIFTGDFGAAKDGAIRALGGLLSFVTTIPRAILGALGNVGGLLLSAGGDLLKGLWNGISGMGGWLKSKLMGFFKGLVPSWARSALGINSPSRVFADLGKYIPEGLAVGIEGNLKPVEDATGTMTRAAMGDYMAGAGSYSGGRSGGGATISFGGNTDGAFAAAFMKMVRTGQIQIRTS